MHINFFGGGFSAVQKPVLEVFPARQRTGRWEVVGQGTTMAIEKVNRGRRAKIDNEKKSEKVSCTLLHRSQGSLVHNVSLHSCLVKSMSSGTNLYLVLFVLVPCICAEFFNFSVTLLLSYTDIHPGCLEICLGDSEGNKNPSLFYRTYRLSFPLLFSYCL